MKIGLVLPEAPQYSETFFNYKIKNLIEAGIDVVVFSNKKEDQETGYKIKSAYPVFENNNIKQFLFTTLILVKSFLTNFRISKKMYELEKLSGNSFQDSLKLVYINAHILSEKTDRLHFGFTTMALKRENAASALGAKMSVSFRGYDINIYPLKNPGCYKKVWEKVDKVHSISDYLHTKAMSLGLPETVPFTKITPAIDLSLFRYKNDAGIIKKKIRILTVGRLNWIKDYETAISAIKILIDKGTDVIYDIVGSGPELERLTFCAYQLGLQSVVIFHGKKDHSEINEIMHQSDLYLQTSMQEGFCGSVLEAQATGLLCIVSDADGLKENVIDDQTGWIAKRRDPGSFAEKIEYVLSMSSEKRVEVSKQARKRVEEEFSLKDQKNKFIKFFTE